MDTSNNNNNNNNIEDSNSTVANILLNKDLTVEVKPVRVKPVVLVPRHPEGNTLYHGRQPTQQATNSVIVSVQPRQERQPALLPPSGRPHSVPRLVEEWFKKMQPPLGSPPMPVAMPMTIPVPMPRHSSPLPACIDALNLSIRVSNESPKPAEIGPTARSTQIFLRPISSIQEPEKMQRAESPVVLLRPPPLSPPRWSSKPRRKRKFTLRWN